MISASPLRWLDDRRARCDMTVRFHGFDECEGWTVRNGEIVHRTGGFFSITGLAGEDPNEDQPVIDQPEIGILGFVVRRDGDRWEVLLHAKPEPGNAGLVQLAPSVQATESNYSRRHGGRATPLLELFRPGHDESLAADIEARVRARTGSSSRFTTGAIQPPEQNPTTGRRTLRVAVLDDELHSEQGTRFLGKYNRNVVVEVFDEVDVVDGLRWFPVDQLPELLLTSHAVNTDARSVIATSPHGPWGRRRERAERLVRHDRSRLDEVLGELQRRRWAVERWSRVPIDQLRGWAWADLGIVSERSDFAIRYLTVTTSEREVDRWSQPIAAATGGDATAMLGVDRTGAVTRYGFAYSSEPGFREGVQIGPLLQLDGHGRCTTRHAAEAEHTMQMVDAGTTLVECSQTDEGGRFHLASCNYRLVEVDAGDPKGRVGEVWLTRDEIDELALTRGMLTNEARTLISVLIGLENAGSSKGRQHARHTGQADLTEAVEPGKSPQRREPT